MIHKYEQNGSYIVLDICSGGVHVVDKLVYDLLDYAKPPDSLGVVALVKAVHIKGHAFSTP